MYTLSKFISIFSSSFFFFFFSRNQILPNSAKRIRTRTRNSENLRAYHRKRITTLVVFLTSETHRSASCIFKRHLDTPNSRPTSTLPPDSVQFLGANLRAGNPRETAVSLSFFLSFLSRNGKLEITTRRWSKSGGPESAGARLFRCSIFLACRHFPRRRSTAFTRARNPGVRLAKLPPWREQDLSLSLSLWRMEAWRFYRNRVCCVIDHRSRATLEGLCLDIVSNRDGITRYVYGESKLFVNTFLCYGSCHEEFRANWNLCIRYKQRVLDLFKYKRK